MTADPTAIAAKINRPRSKEHQPLGKSSVQRQFDYFFLIDELADRARPSVNQLRAGLDRYFL